MANKLVAVFLMCIVVVAAMELRGAEAEPTLDVFKQCFTACHDECTAEGSGSTFCEMKCDTDCTAKEVAAKLNIH